MLSKQSLFFCPINMNQHDVGIRRDIIILLMQSNTAGCFRGLSIRHPWFELFMRLLRLICFQPKLQKIQALVEVSRKYLTKQMLGELFFKQCKPKHPVSWSQGLARQRSWSQKLRIWIILNSISGGIPKGSETSQPCIGDGKKSCQRQMISHFTSQKLEVCANRATQDPSLWICSGASALLAAAGGWNVFFVDFWLLALFWPFMK